MKYRILILALAGFYLSVIPHAAVKPNVLFIAVDDLNDWIGCLDGHPQAVTPNMDRLAQRGVLFTNAHCAAPACNPSRAAVFSGLMPNRTGVWSNDSERIEKKHPKEVLLPHLFRDHGYQTLGTGKMLHGNVAGLFENFYSVNQRWSPFEKNAVRYTKAELPSKGTDNPRHVTMDSLGRQVVLPINRMPSDRKPDRLDGESFDWGGFDVPDSDFGDTKITNWAIKRLQASLGKEKPFFLGVGYYRPHIPLFAPQKYFDRFKEMSGKLPIVVTDDLNDVGPVARKWAREPVTAGSHYTVLKHRQWVAAVEAYLACTTYVDYEIGRLLDALDQSNAATNTWVFLWSDHGWHLGEKEHWGKWTGWERSTKVPLIVVPPKQLASKFAPGGLRCHQPVGLIDLFPTLAEACGLSIAKKLDGESLLPLLRDPSKESGRVLTTTFGKGNISLRTIRWRYLRYVNGEEELYDLKNDPNEWANLSKDSRLSKVKQRLSKAGE
ncbi:MAG: sulfatase [Verrucomicrobiota bacterium]|nr:sulfatase [Verrucomicrobiota bacterium]